MARKKSSKQTAAPSPEFSHSPFKSLKGLSAFEQAKAQAAAGKAAPAEACRPNGPPDEPHAFAEEMDSLGVKPLPGRVVADAGPEPGPAPGASPAPGAVRDDADRNTFLEAVGAMTTTFDDEWPDEETERQAVPRRMKQVARGQLKPEAELDLHGLTVEEATGKVGFFLQNASRHGFQTLLIITGKGLHSNNGPVLREAVAKLLSQAGGVVLEWGVAPRRCGGDGALVVFLRRPGAG